MVTESVKEDALGQGTPRAAAALMIMLTLAACDRETGRDLTLYTHCGIDELQFEDQWYERVGGVLDDGSGNPPAGWDNPEQEGTIERVDVSTLVFTDGAGHREEFVLREGANGPKQTCD